MKQLAPLILALLLASCSLPVSPQAALEPSTSAPTSTGVMNRAPTSTGVMNRAPTSTSAPTATSQPTPTFEPLAPTATLAPLSVGQREQIFDELWQTVRDRYLYEDFGGVNWEQARAEYRPRALEAATPEAFYDTLAELIALLGDDHSRFESPRDVAAEQALFEGEIEYGGIGAVIRDVDEGGLIIRLAPGGPAEDAGLLPGDLVLQVAGTPFTDTAAFGPFGPIGVIRGEPGTPITLTIQSVDQTPREVEVIRRIISSEAFPPVESQRLAGTNVGLLRVSTFFIEDLDGLVRGQLEQLTREGPLDGLIIDLRDNGGGRIDLLLNTLGLFIDGGSIGSSGGRSSSEALEVPGGETVAALVDVPIVVLVGEDTVSAAEMFAAGMQLLGRARVLGLPSAGNTENLIAHGFADGSRLWLAELAYQRPDGSLIEGSGVQPDRLIEAEWWRYPYGEDPQVQAALEELQNATRQPLTTAAQAR